MKYSCFFFLLKSGSFCPEFLMISLLIHIYSGFRNDGRESFFFFSLKENITAHTNLLKVLTLFFKATTKKKASNRFEYGQQQIIR